MPENAEVGARRPAGEEQLRRHLVASRLSGRVATTVQSCRGNAARMVSGDPVFTFGLSDWKEVTLDDVATAMAAAGGVWEHDPEAPPELADSAWIDPEATLAGIRSHRDALAGFLAGGGGRVLVATGHPYGLLSHYAAVVRALDRAGCALLRPLAGRRGLLRQPDGRPCFIGYPEGVAAMSYAGGLHHTHLPGYMEAMLDELGGPDAVDLVLADHGFAGAAIEAGIPTLSIADVNDPALLVARARGRTDGVLLIDDGLEPVLFEPVTAAIVAG